MDDDRNAEIARRAFELWEQSDRTHGHHDEHWRRAEAQLGADAAHRHGIENITSTPSRKESTHRLDKKQDAA